MNLEPYSASFPFLVIWKVVSFKLMHHHHHPELGALSLSPFPPFLMQSSVIPIWHKYGRSHKSASLALPMEERKVAVFKQSIDWCYRICWTWGHLFLWMGFVNYETVPAANYLQLIWSPPHYCGCASCWAGLTTASLSWAASKLQYSLSLYWYLIPSFRWVLTKVHTVILFATSTILH
jgi:hypothetical protein